MPDTLIYHAPGASGDTGAAVSVKQYSANYLRGLYDKFGVHTHLNSFIDDLKYGESVTMPIIDRQTPGSIGNDGLAAAGGTIGAPGTILVDQRPYVRHLVRADTLRYQGKVDVPAVIAQAQIDSLNDGIGRYLCSLITSASNNVGTVGTDLTEATIDGAVQKLLDNHVSLENPNDFVWVLPTSQYAVVRKLTGSYATNYRIVRGMGSDGQMADIQMRVDTLMGVEIYWKNNTELTVSGGHLGGLFYKDSVGVAIQRTPTLEPAVRVPGSINWEYLGWTLFGMSMLKPLLACELRTK